MLPGTVYLYGGWHYMVCVCGEDEDVLGLQVIAGITIENNQVNIGFLWYDMRHLTEVLL